MKRIGTRMIKDGRATPEEWAHFAGRAGIWFALLAIAEWPDLLSEKGWKEFLCDQVRRRPKVVPLFLDLIRQEIAKMMDPSKVGRSKVWPFLELWLHHNPHRGWEPDKGLAKWFETVTGLTISDIDEVRIAREKINRRAKNMPKQDEAAQKPSAQTVDETPFEKKVRLRFKKETGLDLSDRRDMDKLTAENVRRLVEISQKTGAKSARGR